MKRAALISLATATALVAGPSSAREGQRTLIEPPAFADRVRAGTLPTVSARVPEPPRIVRLNRNELEPGRHGGELRILMARPKDVRMMVVYGYARLVAYDTGFRLKADILERYEIEEGRRFTLYLRKGHKWSDGHPFSSEDFRYYWEDIANNEELSPVGPPRVLLVNGEKPQFEILGPTIVRFTWSQPNSDFLPALAGATPLYIYRPAHYLRRFHKRYAKSEALRRRVEKAGLRNWAALHNRRDNQYKNDNPALPTLQPWISRTKPPSQRFIFERNPYYHRIDSHGRQLPYIDRVVMNIASARIIPAKTGAGESDLQARGVHFSDYTFLKMGEKKGNFSVRLWRTAKGAHFVLFPNLNVNDPAWRTLFRDVRFRRALSLAVDRHEINQVVYFGLALEGNNSVLPQSPLYKTEYRQSWAQFNLERANALLDAIGLTRRNSRGIRLLPDGRPLNVIVETAGEDTEQTDILELIHDSWQRTGIKLYSRPSQREVFRNRIFAGETMISVWSGYENGLPNENTSPIEFAPTTQTQLQWPKWGQHFQTGGAVGEAPDLPGAKDLVSLFAKWQRTLDASARREIWQRMLQIHADNVFSIGVVGAVPQPVVVTNRLRNLPRKGVYNWNPGAHFGIYRPDIFWFADAGRGRARRK